jgi:hypothetical protein
MKKNILVLMSLVLANYMAAQGLARNGGIVTEATFNTINAGNIISNETISSSIGSFGKLVLLTVEVDALSLNNYNVSNTSVLIITGNGESTFDLYGFSGGTMGQIIYLIDQRTAEWVQSIELKSHMNDGGSANQRMLFRSPLNGGRLEGGGVATLVFTGTYWKVLTGGRM